MKIEDKLTESVLKGVKELYGAEVPAKMVQLQKTKKEFEGHLTLVVFPFLKMSKKSPEQTALEIGEYLKQNEPAIANYNVIKGFLNLTIASDVWVELLNRIHADAQWGIQKATENSPLVMIEYLSPNTNKPLHLGHVRNNLLGNALANVMAANGNKVVKTNIVNDRGIHTCKSMLAWLKYGNGETPESSGKKGDHLIGDYYVAFDKHYKAEVAELMEKGLSKEEAEAQSPLMLEAREMLRKWEANDPEVRALWKKMNDWVYAGFDETYKMMGVSFDKIYYESETYLEGKEKVMEGVRALWKKMNDWVYAGFDETYKMMGVSFDKIYYESETYLEGKEKVMEGLEKGFFFRKEDGSVWADLTAEGLDHKLLLRADGTSVYMTQDIGTAKLRFQDYPIDKMIYVVGNEQNYHFQVLSILDKIYYESETYLEGKEKVMEGLEKGFFFRKEDGSVWADLTAEGLDHKLLLRADGTSVYMTQDIGTAKLRFQDYPIDKMIYVVGNEQNYHFQVLSILLDKLGFEWGKDLVHFSYGMVELPEGKMKSREGTVVDADDLMEAMIETAKETSNELGKRDGLTQEEADDIARIVGLGALKYFILKVDARKNMTFNPKESIDFNGNTGPFIQYTYARIQSILRKAAEAGITVPATIPSGIELSVKEEGLIQMLADFTNVVKQAGGDYNPSILAIYAYDLVNEYNQFYHDFSILREENEALKVFRLALSQNVGKVVKLAMGLLGIEVPERM